MGPFSNAQQQNLVVGLEVLDYLPYYQTNDFQKKPSGYAVELIELFAHKYHYSVQFKSYPVRRLFSNLLAGKIDFKYPDSPKWSPEIKINQGLHYSDSTVEIVDGILTLEKNRRLLLDEFVTMGSIRGFKPWPYMQAIDRGDINLIEASSIEQLIRLLEKGRIQGIYLNTNVGIRYASNYFDGLKLYWNKSLPFAQDDYSLSTIKYPQILKKFNAFIVKYQAEISTLKKKYKLEKINNRNKKFSDIPH